MRVGMVFPDRKKCGVAMFTAEVISGLLAAGVEVIPLDSALPPAIIKERLDGCQVAHVQYETGMFFRKRKDRFQQLMHSIAIPSIVSLHEVYVSDPFVFPKESIYGTGLVPFLRRAVWDVRHPLQRVAVRHATAGYYATVVQVFYRYQKDILVSKGTPSSKIRVLSLPLLGAQTPSPFGLPHKPCIRLGALGFVNPQYDYSLLFSALKALDRPWTFTWLGGVREDCDTALYDEITTMISREGWMDRFRVTGWVEEDEFTRELDRMDMVLTLFSSRSTSASIARAMGAGKPVVATRLPLTRELAGEAAATPGGGCGPLLLVDAAAESVKECIERFVNDSALRRSLYDALLQVHTNMSLEQYVRELVQLYREVVD